MQNEFCLLQLGVFITINNSKPTKQGPALVVSLSFSLATHFVGPFLLVLPIERNNLSFVVKRKTGKTMIDTLV